MFVNQTPGLLKRKLTKFETQCLNSHKDKLDTMSEGSLFHMFITLLKKKMYYPNEKDV